MKIGFEGREWGTNVRDSSRDLCAPSSKEGRGKGTSDEERDRIGLLLYRVTFIKFLRSRDAISLARCLDKKRLALTTRNEKSIPPPHRRDDNIA